jgi:hypothetical protein
MEQSLIFVCIQVNPHAPFAQEIALPTPTSPLLCKFENAKIWEWFSSTKNGKQFSKNPII